MDFVMNDEVSRSLKEVEAAKDRLRDAIRAFKPEPVEECTLRNTDGSEVRLSALFNGREDLILWHNMGRSCVYCTLWADGLRGFSEHLENRAALALTSPDEPAVLRQFAESRGWKFRCVSTHGTGLLDALRMADNGKPWPGISALHMDGSGRIVRTGYSYFGPGDDFCPVWPTIDLLKDGARGWEPRYSYGPDVPSVGIKGGARA